MDRDQIIGILGRTLSQPRLEHCLRVEATALSLAERFDVAADLITPAALFHDLCREDSPDNLLKLAANFGIVIDEIQKEEPLLLHGLVAAEIVKKDFGIEHPAILEAISFHITGRPGSSSLSKLIFIADFIEPGRTFEKARFLREKAFLIHPEELLLYVYNFTICYLLRQGFLLHPDTVAARNELVMKGVKTD